MNNYKITAACRVDIGHVRKNNEDNVYFDGRFILMSDADKPFFVEKAINADSGIFGVFDGMGGESFGEFASEAAAMTLLDYDRQFRQALYETLPDLAKSYTRDANNIICQKMIETNTRIGSTYAILVIRNQRALVFNVGDSRIYLFRDGTLRQLSEDHNTAAQLNRLGLSMHDNKRSAPSKNMLTQHLGIFEDEMVIEPHISPFIELRPGDMFLLGSDGLTGMLNDPHIRAFLQTNGTVDEKVNNLVAEALRSGGKDNVSTILIAIDPSDMKLDMTPNPELQRKKRKFFDIFKGSGKTKGDRGAEKRRKELKI